eukprot:CAMPEP_0183349948 /NCGR_PEP_ID=MMETSP0164_2-20130417/15248_1 /TAXON_ID=221442 /ORGANISM="Coccolithus pelagicus ssp braarudi, Strain PLY182g" /LENGTH=223 /DNA_ID=CAMNT_0025521771 /DNA_START=29 /DNA_END=700 /DNA_ORIENTATION=-
MAEDQPQTGAVAPEEDDNGVAPEEEAQVEFEPLVKLEEVKTATLEEDETLLNGFKMRAKLFRWESDTWEKEKKMWKERGTGDVRFLQHNETKKVRVLMRREKTMKICANFFVDPSSKLLENAGSDRSWNWQCHDFSEEKNDISLLAIRFANTENSQKFKAQFLEAQEINKTLPSSDADAPAAASTASAEEGAAPAPADEKKEAEAAPAAAEPEETASSKTEGA